MVALRAAMQAAKAMGCTLRQHQSDPALCFIICDQCGYGAGEGREAVIEKYAASPFGCIVNHAEAA